MERKNNAFFCSIEKKKRKKKMEEENFIDKILFCKKEDSKEYFLIKEKNLSYLHLKWFEKKDLEEHFENAKLHLNRFYEKGLDNSFIEEEKEIYFDQRFKTIEKILRLKQIGEKIYFYCKWSLLPFSQSTWEEKSFLIEHMDEQNLNNLLQKLKDANNKTKINDLRFLFSFLNQIYLNFLLHNQIFRPDLSSFEKEFQIPQFPSNYKLKDYQEEGKYKKKILFFKLEFKICL